VAWGGVGSVTRQSISGPPIDVEKNSAHTRDVETFSTSSSSDTNQLWRVAMNKAASGAQTTNQELANAEKPRGAVSTRGNAGTKCPSRMAQDPPHAGSIGRGSFFRTAALSAFTTVCLAGCALPKMTSDSTAPAEAARVENLVVIEDSALAAMTTGALRQRGLPAKGPCRGEPQLSMWRRATTWTAGPQARWQTSRASPTGSKLRWCASRTAGYFIRVPPSIGWCAVMWRKSRTNFQTGSRSAFA
jgi:hypothetical protein